MVGRSCGEWFSQRRLRKTTNWWGQNTTTNILKDYYHQDRMGSTTNMTDVYGRVVGRADYNEWGQITYRDALNITSSYRRIYPQLNYTGYDWDDVLGMYYAKARFYSADDKRFVAMDPVKGNITEPLSLVSYLYCVDNPLRYIDPLGLLPTNRVTATHLGEGEDSGSKAPVVPNGRPRPTFVDPFVTLRSMPDIVEVGPDGNYITHSHSGKVVPRFPEDYIPMGVPEPDEDSKAAITTYVVSTELFAELIGHAGKTNVLYVDTMGNAVIVTGIALGEGGYAIGGTASVQKLEGVSVFDVAPSSSEYSPNFTFGGSVTIPGINVGLGYDWAVKDNGGFEPDVQGIISAGYSVGLPVEFHVTTNIPTGVTRYKNRGMVAISDFIANNIEGLGGEADGIATYIRITGYMVQFLCDELRERLVPKQNP